MSTTRPLVPLGEEIVRLLGERHWTRNELSDKTGISRGALSKLVRGQHAPKPETLTAIASALSVDPLYLMRLAGLPLPPSRSERHPAVEGLAQRLDALPLEKRLAIVATLNAVVDGIERVCAQGESHE